MADTALDICSRALVALGENPITSFSANTTPSKVAAQLYESTVRSMLSLDRWKFSRTTIQMARLSQAPIDGGWTAAYQIPADWLETCGLTVNGHAVAFEQFENTLRCDAAVSDEVILKYVRRVPEAWFPASFVAALEAELAARFAFPVTAQESLAGTKRKEASQITRQARTTQSQGETAKRLPVSRFKAVRRGRA